MGNGITFRQWFDRYGVEPFPVTADEIAFGVMARVNWAATPELHAYLVKMIHDEGIATDGDSLGEDRRAST